MKGKFGKTSKLIHLILPKINPTVNEAIPVCSGLFHAPSEKQKLIQAIPVCNRLFHIPSEKQKLSQG